MADISQVKIGNTTYNIKDTTGINVVNVVMILRFNISLKLLFTISFYYVFLKIARDF